jgi:protein-tyrosine kinase
LSIIEQATRRLEELRRGGIEVSPKREPAGASGNTSAGDSLPTRLARKLESERTAADERPLGQSRPALGGAAAASRRERATESGRVEIDLSRLAAMGYLTPETPRVRIADEFRVIKRPILSNIQIRSGPTGSRANLIMVTSSLPGEGKTFVSLNLAISLAMELDKTVLLVDADVSRPSVLKRLGLAPSPGLLDVLTNPTLQMADVMLRTNIEKLTILPSGQANPRATELLASESMDRLLDEFAVRYPDRVVVFDAPPLLPSTESRVLATYMGQVIVVVEADRTPQKALTQALAAIDNCPIVLPLLNKTGWSDAGAYYGYYGPT